MLLTLTSARSGPAHHGCNPGVGDDSVPDPGGWAEGTAPNLCDRGKRGTLASDTRGSCLPFQASAFPAAGQTRGSGWDDRGRV